MVDTMGKDCSFEPSLITPILDDAGYRILSCLLNSATKSIFVLSYEIKIMGRNNANPVNDLLGILKRKTQDNLDVKILINGFFRNALQSSFNVQSHDTLKKEGFNIRIGNPKKMIHAKIIIIDKRKVFLGSYNWTLSSLMKNHETGVLINANNITADYVTYFNALWIEGR